MLRIVSNVVIVLLFSVSSIAQTKEIESVLPSIYFLLSEEDVEIEEVVCPDFLTTITGDQAALPNSSRPISPVIVSTLNVTNTNDPFSGVIEWSISGTEGSGLTVFPLSGRDIFGVDGIFTSATLSADPGTQSGLEVPVVVTFTLITNDRNGNECNREEFSANVTYFVI